MFDFFFKDIRYEEYIGKTSSNTNKYSEPRLIKGLRLKGYIKVTTDGNGESTSCSIAYKTKEKIKPFSKLNGREVTECIPVEALFISEEDAGYISYVK